MKEITHQDGLWKTSTYSHNNRKIIIKSRKGKGMKCHVFYPNSADKVDFTLRYEFILPETLLQKAKNKIDATK